MEPRPHHAGRRTLRPPQDPLPPPSAPFPTLHTKNEMTGPYDIRADPSPPPLPPPPPSPGPGSYDEGGRGRGPRDSKFQAMEGLTHTTELRPSPALRIYFAILNFKRLAAIEPERASHTTELGALRPHYSLLRTPSHHPPPLHHSPHLPLPRPWLLMREAEAAKGLRIYFAILNFKRLVEIEPSTLP